MGENAPKGFLTDQCASIKRALEACMPTTVHRWCIWHIMKKIPSKLNGYKGHADIEQQMSHVVWNSHSKDSFDRNWNDFLVNVGLADNKWLSDLYEDRHIWGSPSPIQRKGELHHQIKEFRSRLFSIRSRRTSFQLNIGQVRGYLRLSCSRGKMPMLIIRVERDTVPSRTKRVKLRTSKPSVP
ncbi:protein FAR1-RELATED SEQUENCE 4-like [Arachis stenosperma]|uniref:protein FAR1-RELATED SEQUENCE 4-like n=1 Tax=Arachis stenosperma TaxID=217475 RepID=UPI0025AC3AC5|nr:protein FAR1-RELATED SEQUENCE 4-like [Arachis stenosperma]